MTLRELVEDANGWAAKHRQAPFVIIPDGKTIETVLQESLPRTSDKAKGNRPIPDDIHARLAAAMRGERLLGAKPLSEVMDLDEAPREAKVVEIPEGMHQKLANSR